MRRQATRLPDFIIIGAQKSGTTTLLKNLREHRAVHIGATPPHWTEMHFFDEEENWSKGVAWYRGHFDRPHLLQGEKTPEYLSNPVAIERIAATIPDAKLIVLLRNPAQRAYSQWNHFNQEADRWARFGWEAVPFENALERSRTEPRSIFGQLLEKGLYARQLAKVFEHFDPEQVYIGIAERWQLAPTQEYEHLLDFLGLESVDGDVVNHHVRDYERPMDTETAAWLDRFFSDANEDLYALLGEEVPEWRNDAQRSRQIPGKPAAPFGAGYDVCFVTTCMGRLEHLQQSLPRMVSQRSACALVVDYSCPQGAGDWVEQEFDPAQVHVVRVDGQTHYSTSRSRNAGAFVPASRWIAMIDADTLLPERFLDAHMDDFCEGQYYVFVDEPQHWGALPEGHEDLYGLVIARPRDLRRLGGYDEVLEGWGAEDVDLRARLRDAGLKEVRLFGRAPAAIAHGDDDRTRNQPFASKRLSNAINLFYVNMKRDIVKLSGAQLSLEQRRTIYRSVQSGFRQAVASSKPFQLELSLPSRGLVEMGTSMARRLVYEIKVTPGTFELTEAGADNSISVK